MTDPVGLARGLTNYGDRDFALYLRRSFAKSMGYSRRDAGRPVVGIANTASGFNNCHRQVPELVEAVKRGVLAAGALPLEFPTVSLGEVFLNPTSLMFRNLMAMDTEEMIRAQPMDAVVLVGGCDKTVPAQLMGAASADLPAIQLVTGPMMTGTLSRRAPRRLHRLPALLGALSRRRGRAASTIDEIEGRLATTAGTCAVMGTASTMAVARRGARHDAAGHGGDSRRPCRPAARRRGDRRRRGGAGAADAHPRPHHHRRGGRERAARAAGDRRLDQRHPPSDGDRRPRRRRHPARRGSTS